MIKQAVKSKQDYPLVLLDKVSKDAMLKALGDLEVQNVQVTQNAFLWRGPPYTWSEYYTS